MAISQKLYYINNNTVKITKNDEGVRIRMRLMEYG